MTLARRLEKLEIGLTPTQLVLRWLAEAHAHGSLTEYVGALLDEPPATFPLNRLAREAVTSGRAGPRRIQNETDAAVRAALQQTIFRFELVMQINVTAHELVDREALVRAVIMGHLTLLAGEHPKAQADAGHHDRLATSRDLKIRRVIELHAVASARSIAETRYLDGHAALFAEELEAWAAQVHESERLGVMAERLAELDGLGPCELDEEAVLEARVPMLLSDLVEPAKATTFEKLGDGPRAIGIATAWLRASALG